jgi:hypothetical protein
MREGDSPGIDLAQAQTQRVPPSSAAPALDWHVLEAASRAFVVRSRMLDFLSQLEVAASLLPGNESAAVRSTLAPLYQEFRRRDPVAGVLNTILNGP